MPNLSHDRAIPTPRIAKSHSPGNGIARALKPHATSVSGKGKIGLLTPGSGKLDPASGNAVTCVPRKGESVFCECQHFGVKSTGKDIGVLSLSTGHRPSLSHSLSHSLSPRPRHRLRSSHKPRPRLMHKQNNPGVTHPVRYCGGGPKRRSPGITHPVCYNGSCPNRVTQE